MQECCKIFRYAWHCISKQSVVLTIIAAFHLWFVNLSSAQYQVGIPGKTGCPKSVDVPKIMSDMIILEQYKARLFEVLRINEILPQNSA